jgi:hypothetical protein
MKKISRPLVFTLVAVVALAVLSFALANHFGATDHGVHLVMFDEDLSDSPLGWLIAIPVMIFVGILLVAVFAGVAMIVTAALAFAAVMVVLAMTLAFTPLAIFFGLPLLMIYGVYKLIQRDRRAMQAA